MLRPNFSAPVAAQVRPAMLYCFTILLLSCTPGEPSAGLAPAPTSPITQIVVAPSSVTMDADAVQQFTVGATHEDGSSSVPSVTWTATGGTIASNGTYTPAGTGGNFSVTATVPGTSISSSASVTVVPVTSPIVSVTVSPGAASLFSGETATFVATATRQDGSTTTPSVTWSATGGTITSSGTFTAGSTSGTYQVVVTLAGGTLADTASVSVTVPVLQAIHLSPSNVSIITGGSRLFTVTGEWSGGATTAPAVSYSATGGTITPGGLYTAGGSTGTFRVIATQVGGSLADTSSVSITLAPPNDMYFNSSEAGCGTDPSVIMCDDFEDGDWYTKDCDQANSSGGLLQTDGWCGTIYANPIFPAGAASCGAQGAGGTDCAANGGVHTGAQGGRNMGTHRFAGGPVEEVWARWYYRTDPGYRWGAEKNVNFTKAAGDITWFNIQFNCGTGSALTTANPSIQIIHGSDVCQRPNVSSINLQSGRWYFFEVHAKLNSSGTVADGLIEMWINDCGANGICSGTPELRTRMTNVRFNRNQSGCQTSPCKIEVLWFENWANPGSTGTGYFDQIKISTSGPVGFMP